MTIRNKFAACILHFLASAVIFSILVIILLASWYPAPYFSASGGWQGLRIAALVDLVLGPLLTLVVFDPRKTRRHLTIDLGIIVLIQAAALLWGTKAIYEQRPVAVVFLDDSFYTVPAASITQQRLDLTLLSEFGSDWPVYTYVQRPASGEALQRFAREAYELHIPPHEQVWLYQPLDENFATIRRSSLNVREVMAANAEMKADIEDLLEDTGTALDDNYYIALTSRYRNVILVFDAQGRILGTVSAPYKRGEV